MKKLPLPLSALFVALALLPSVASASDESIELTMEAEAMSGSLFREVPRPVDASLKVTVVTPPTATTVTPLKVSTIRFPADMFFNPDPSVTPVCPASKVGPKTNLALGTAAIVDLCPKSVVGPGTPSIYLGKFRTAKLDDPELVVFNAGRDSKGRPRITIYGYSKSVTAGVLMNGVLARDGRLEIKIGVLPVDSSVADFTLGIPGEPLEVADPSVPSGKRSVSGLDPTYLEAKCSKDLWIARGDFVLGERDGSTGGPIGEETLLRLNPLSLACVGLKGGPRLSNLSVKGPRKVKSGRKANFVVSITNRGTASARKVKLQVPGSSAKASAGRIAPGATRKAKVRTRVSGRRGTRKKIAFKVSTQGRPSGRVVATVLIG